MIVLLTGATGFVGIALALELKNSGYEVVSAVRESRSADRQVSVGNIDGDTDWTQALAGCEFVVHLAARAHIMRDHAADPLSAYRCVNTEGTLNFARQAVAAGVKRFVFISSVKVNGEQTLLGRPFSESDAPAPQDAYGQSKHEAEVGLLSLAASTSMEVVIVRPPLVYGPGVKANFGALIRAVRRGYPLPLGSVNNQRSFLGIDNLVDFIGVCLKHPAAANQTFLVSDGHDMSTTELVRGMAHAAGVPLYLWSVQVRTLILVANLLGMGGSIQRLCGNLQVDSTKARHLLGWVPPVSVDESLRRAMGFEKES